MKIPDNDDILIYNIGESMLRSGDLVRHVRTMDIRMVIDEYVDRKGRKHYVLCDGKRYRDFTLFRIKESDL